MLYYSYEKIRDFESPTQINTAALHPEKTIFISGGENFIMYKSDYQTGEELGNVLWLFTNYMIVFFVLHLMPSS